MKLDSDQLIEIGKLIQKSQSILLISHKSPDGDTLGSSLGLHHVFTEMGKKTKIYCLDKPAPVFNFMPEIEKVEQEIPNPSEYDLIFTVDVGATHLTGLHESHPQLFDKTLPVVNIDHHVSNDYFGKYNLVVTTAASATEVVYVMLKELGLPMSRFTATCLLTGIYTDTGSFMHSNTTSHVLRIAAKLIARGADVRSISKDIFNTLPISSMHLWGRVLKSIQQTSEGVTMAVLKQKDFDESKAAYSEIEGVVDYVNSVPGAAYSVLLTERGDVVKGSLRTLKDEIDVAAIAQQYGGGGHTKAAGFAVKGHLEQEIRWQVVSPTET